MRQENPNPQNMTYANTGPRNELRPLTELEFKMVIILPPLSEKASYSRYLADIFIKRVLKLKCHLEQKRVVDTKVIQERSDGMTGLK